MAKKKKEQLFQDSRKKGFYSGFDELKAELEEEGSASSASPDASTAADDNSSAPAEEQSSAKKSGGEGASPTRSALEEPVEAAEREKSPTQRLNLEIDENVHRRFKGVVGMEGRTMTEVIEGFMQSYVEEARSRLLD